jgi:prolipoprotein diacylglyceryltransferase
MPQFVTVFGAAVNVLTVFVAAAIAASLVRALRTSDMPGPALVAHAGYALLALVLARVFYALGEWSYFSGEPQRLIDLRATPGLSLHGAAVGWLCAAALARRQVWPAPSALAPGLVLAAVGLGCVSNGCAHGRELYWSDSLWPLAVDWPDAYLIRNPRLPTQALQAGLGLLAAILAVRRGADATQLIALLAIGDFGLQFWRGDPAQSPLGVRLEQWLDIAILCLSTLFAYGFSAPTGAFSRKHPR